MVTPTKKGLANSGPSGRFDQEARRMLSRVRVSWQGEKRASMPQPEWRIPLKCFLAFAMLAAWSRVS